MPVKKITGHELEKLLEKKSAVKAKKEKKFKNILIRMPCEILDQLDAHLETMPWLTRTPWVVEAILERLKRTGE